MVTSGMMVVFLSKYGIISDSTLYVDFMLRYFPLLLREIVGYLYSLPGTKVHYVEMASIVDDGRSSILVADEDLSLKE